MTKKLWLLVSSVFCVLLGIFGLHQYQVTQRAHLRLDQRTSAILQNATRVEAYRLADFNESRFFTEAETDAIKRFNKRFEDYFVTRVGRPQDKQFAVSLAQALSVADDPKESPQPSCFDPGVAYRVWSGKECVDVCVCFSCSGMDMVTRNARNQVVSEKFAALGEARDPLLLLCRKAFPDDARLQALHS